MLVLLPEVKEVRVDVMIYDKTYNFVIAKDWWGINKLPFCLGVDKTCTVWVFEIKSQLQCLLA